MKKTRGEWVLNSSDEFQAYVVLVVVRKQDDRRTAAIQMYSTGVLFVKRASAKIDLDVMITSWR